MPSIVGFNLFVGQRKILLVIISFTFTKVCCKSVSRNPRLLSASQSELKESS